MVDDGGGSDGLRGAPADAAPAGGPVAEAPAAAVGDLSVEDLIALFGIPVVRRGAGADHGGEEPEDEDPLSWLDAVGHPERGPVEWLGELAPSGRLLSELEALPADTDLDDYEAVELVWHWHRLEAYCAYRKRVAAAGLARRHAMAEGLAALKDLNGGLGVVTGQPNIAGDELSARLGIGARAARTLVDSGRAFSWVAIPTGEALAAGEIDAAKADLIAAAVTDLGPDAALAVQERVLTRASYLPTGSLRRELAAACAAVDPAEFEDRAAHAATKRRVSRPRVLPDGMAGFYAELPAFEATQLYRAVDAAARSAKAAGDPRTMDQLRADALALMGITAVQTGWIGPPPDPPPPTPGEDHAAGAGIIPSEHEPHPPHEAGDPHQRNVPEHGSDGASPTRERPGVNGPPGGVDRRADHRPPGGLDPGGGDLGPSGDPGRATGPGVSMRVGRIGSRSAHVRVVVPLHSLMGTQPPTGAVDDPAARSEGTGVPTADRDAGTDGTGMPTGAVDDSAARSEGTAVPTADCDAGTDGTGMPTGAVDDPAARSEGTGVPAAECDGARTDGTAAPTTGTGCAGVEGGTVRSTAPPGAAATGQPATGRAATGQPATGQPGAAAAPSAAEWSNRGEHPDDPAYLEGYGPFPASVARALAAESVWQRLVLDPIDGTVRELTSPKYRPPAAMADLVRAEQPECSMTGCRVPADECDLDHHIPWPVGRTRADDLDPDCRRHHLLRTHAGWTHTRAGRQRTWTTTTGHAYTEHPDGTITHNPRTDDPPPF